MSTKVYLKESTTDGIPDRLIIEEENGLTVTMWPGHQSGSQDVIAKAFLQLLARIERLTAELDAKSHQLAMADLADSYRY